jgi:hypothetical protein
VVDRFHIIKGLGEALERFLLTKGNCLRQVTLAPTVENSPTAPPEEAPHGPHLQRLAEASQRRLARRVEQYQVVDHLHARGVDVLRIAEAVGISRPTVYRYLSMPEPPQPKQAPRRQRALLDPYLPYLLRRWDEGCQHGQRLWSELRDQGFRDAPSTVFRGPAERGWDPQGGHGGASEPPGFPRRGSSAEGVRGNHRGCPRAGQVRDRATRVRIGLAGCVHRRIRPTWVDKPAALASPSLLALPPGCCCPRTVQASCAAAAGRESWQIVTGLPWPHQCVRFSLTGRLRPSGSR